MAHLNLGIDYNLRLTNDEWKLVLAALDGTATGPEADRACKELAQRLRSLRTSSAQHVLGTMVEGGGTGDGGDKNRR